MKAEGSRDRALEQLLRRSLAADRGAHASDACLDAETLAAWLDGGLDDQAAAMAEAHASGCARCQALMGAMARSAPEIPVPVPWWRSLRFGFLVPLAAGAAVVVFALIVPGYRLMSPVQERPEPAAVADAPRPETAAPAAVPPAPVIEESRAAAPTPKPAALPPPAAPVLKAAPPPQSSDVPQLRDELARGAGQEAAADKRAAEKPDAAGERRADNRPVLERDTPPAASPAAPPAPASPAPARALGATAGGGRFAPVPLCGATWKQLPTNVPAELTAGSSPSAAVCWVIGRGGVVLLSTDGRTWQRVPFPEPADLATVKAVDARTVTVTTTDGRTFLTTDAGSTWTRP